VIESGGWKLVASDGTPVAMLSAVRSANGMQAMVTGGLAPRTDGDVGIVFTGAGVHAPGVWGLQWVKR